jgi:TolB-like protein/Flp pilus assembly protein TadD
MTAQPEVESPVAAAVPPSIPEDARLGDEFWVGSWRVETASNRLCGEDGEERRLEPQLASLLRFFAARHGEVVSKDQILEGVWGSRHVADSALTRAIAELRRGLGDEAHNPSYIETIPKRGYRLLAEVRRGRDSATPPPPKEWRPRLAAALVVSTLVLAGVVTADLIQRSQAPEATAVPPPARRVAVLPLVDLSGEETEAYFGDAMTDALITALARVPSLSVTSRRSVERYRNSDAPSPEIAQGLGVDLLLEGTILRDANRVRITVQLVDPTAETHLWAGSYERPLRDVVSLQGEIVSAIASEIKVSLGAEARRDLAGRSVNPRAHDLYLRGRYLLEPGPGKRPSDAPELFRRALEIDPTYAPAWSGIADYYTQQSNNMLVEPNEGYPKAKQAALEALALDPNLAEAHASLGTVVFLHEWDWEQADRHFRRALELNPSEARVRRQYAFFLTCRGQFDEAIAQSLEAIRLDPLTEDQRSGLGWIYLNAGRHEDSLRVFEEQPPGGRWSGVAATYVAWNHALMGRHDEAIAVLGDENLRRGGLLQRAALAWTLGRAGRQAEAREIQRQIEERVAEGGDAYLAAIAAAGLGDVEAATRWLERAIAQHSPNMIHVRVEPFFEPLRDAPEYHQIVERMKL